MNFRPDLKNPTPQQLALYASVIIAISILLLLIILKITVSNELPWYVLMLIPIIIFLVAFYTIAWALEKYIYRKIKLIYKTIRTSKIEPKDKNQRIDLSSDIIDEVEKEVELWTKTQKNQINELKSLAEYRRNFMGDISHELKTPIFNIQGYLHTLLDGGLEDENINIQYLQHAAKNVERLHHIVQDLESISLMESQAITLNIQEFNIKELTQLVFEEFMIKAKENNIELKFKPGADKGFNVNGDKERISQVLVNLISNSIKYGKQGGYTQVSFYDMDKVILVEVADNGIGISEQDLSHIFDRFYRVDKSRSRHKGGTGLGLAIVKHIVDIHQQTLNVRSTLGRGSTFGFTLEKN